MCRRDEALASSSQCALALSGHLRMPSVKAYSQTPSAKIGAGPNRSSAARGDMRLRSGWGGAMWLAPSLPRLRGRVASAASRVGANTRHPKIPPPGRLRYATAATLPRKRVRDGASGAPVRPHQRTMNSSFPRPRGRAHVGHGAFAGGPTSLMYFSSTPARRSGAAAHGRRGERPIPPQGSGNQGSTRCSRCGSLLARISILSARCRRCSASCRALPPSSARAPNRLA